LQSNKKNRTSTYFPKQFQKHIRPYKCYKLFNSDLWNCLYNKGKRHRVVRRLYYLYYSFPVKFPRFKFIQNLKRKYFSSKRRSFLGKTPDFFKLLLTLKFRSYGGFKKPWLGTRHKRRIFFLRKLRAFYGSYTWRRWYKFFKKRSIGNSQGRHDTKFLEIFELRLCTILFRSSFCTTMLDAKEIIRLGFVFVNNRIIRCPYYIINDWDVITFLPCFKKRLLKLFIHRLKFYRFFIGAPLYLEINYKIAAIIFIRKFFLPKFIRTTFETRLGILQGVNA